DRPNILLEEEVTSSPTRKIWLKLPLRGGYVSPFYSSLLSSLLFICSQLCAITLTITLTSQKPASHQTDQNPLPPIAVTYPCGKICHQRRQPWVATIAWNRRLSSG